ncbi:MAG: two pore domain potassium channel family protein [Flavobacterium sp.]|nr:two pore domain potassium channel family protein [Flavobacterium sp.]
MEKQNKFSLFNHLWKKESGLSSMLILLFVMHFVLIPMLGSYSSFLVVLNIFWMLFLLAGIFALSKSRKQAVLISIVPILFSVFGWISAFNPTPFTVLMDLILSISTFLLLIILVLLKVFEPGPITSYRVIGSVVVYMLMANLWEVVYLFFYQHIEGSFQITLPPFQSNSLDANFMYFSYITITTTGFGEIVPLHPMARALVQVEALIGVLYPVILIGRLVSDANKIQPEK